MVFKIEWFNQVLELIYNQDPRAQIFALIGLRKLLSIEKTPPIQEVIDSNLLPLMVNYLSHPEAKF